MLTAQEILNKAYKGVMDQGGPSLSGNGLGCKYRSESGRACGVGHLVKDEDYSEEFDSSRFGTSIRALVRDDVITGALLANGIDARAHIELLEQIQIAHDNAARLSWTDKEFLGDFTARMEQVAQAFGLEAPTP